MSKSRWFTSYSAKVTYRRKDGTEGVVFVGGATEQRARDEAAVTIGYYNATDGYSAELTDIVMFCEKCEGRGVVGRRAKKICPACAGSGTKTVYQKEIEGS